MKSFYRACATLVIFIATTASAESQFNYQCRLAYRDATVAILDGVDVFKKEIQNATKDEKWKARSSLIAKVGSTEASLNSKRAACYLFEDASNKGCVRAYSGVYKEVRERINLIALATGHQQDVDLDLLSTVTLRGKLLYYDVRCK